MVATGRSPYTDGLNLNNLKVETQRGFVPTNEKCQVLDTEGNVVEGVWCIGDANGKLMLAHAASTQGISCVENMVGRENVVNHEAIQPLRFTHPEVSFVGLTEEQARERAERRFYHCHVQNVVQGEFEGVGGERGWYGQIDLRSEIREDVWLWIFGLPVTWT